MSRRLLPLSSVAAPGTYTEVEIVFNYRLEDGGTADISRPVFSVRNDVAQPLRLYPQEGAVISSSKMPRSPSHAATGASPTPKI